MLNVGIVGLGDGGLSNLRSLQSLGQKQARIAALCDLEDNARKNAIKELGEKVAECADVKELLKHPIELVIIATPDVEHLKPAKIALESGKFVFVEKPLATSLDDLFQFAELAIAYPGKLLFSEKYSFANPVLATYEQRGRLGKLVTGSTWYTMWRCDRIMGGGKWRTEHAYNPCAGGLSHNFMTLLLFNDSPITRVRAAGQVLTYHENLDNYGGYDTMEGGLEFADGTYVQWHICLAVQNDVSPFQHRTVSQSLQFKNGALLYSPDPLEDRLFVNGEREQFTPEPSVAEWGDYNKLLYKRMHLIDLINPVCNSDKAVRRHTVYHGMNVAAACTLAFQSAKVNGAWLEIPRELQTYS